MSQHHENGPIAIGVIGCGYWGPNLVRNLCRLNEFEITGVADLNPGNLDHISRQFPVGYTTTDANNLLLDPTIEAVVIATPISTHADLAHRALSLGKHVLVEKPMAHAVRECEELIACAQDANLVLLVGHTFLYSTAVEYIRELIDRGHLGDIYYFDSVRANLGNFQTDCNVIWDLATHDLSILLYLIDQQVAEVHAVGTAGVTAGTWSLESIAYLTVRFASGSLAHVNVSWLSPVKIRRICIGGSRRTIVWNDIAVEAKIQIYDRRVEIQHDTERPHRTCFQYRIGNIHVPTLERTEALKKELIDFHHSIRYGQAPKSDARLGRDVVKLLEYAGQSLVSGQPIAL